jgi:pimeloyl-ACP methyl ester carboxylesterase
VTRKSAREERALIARGVSLNVRRWDDGPLSLFLLHGLGEGAFAWDAFARDLDFPGGLAAVDLRGHGESAWDRERGYDAATHANDVIHLLRVLEARELILVGHSLGGEVALRVAAACPERARALVLLEAGPALESRPAAHLLEQFRAQPWSYESIDDYAAYLERRGALADAPGLRAFAMGALRRCASGNYELKCDPAIKEHLSRPDTAALYGMLNNLRCPLLVVRGAISAMLSQRGAQMTADAARNATVATVPCAGHGLLLDNPAGVIQSLLPFLNSCQSSR